MQEQVQDCCHRCQNELKSIDDDFGDIPNNYIQILPNVVQKPYSTLKSKLRIDLVPVEAIDAIAEVLTHGCTKYGDREWEKGMNYMYLYGATLRHVLSWRASNESDLDKESGLNHLKHALARLAMLVTLVERRGGCDDRNTLVTNYNAQGGTKV